MKLTLHSGRWKAVQTSHGINHETSEFEDRAFSFIVAYLFLQTEGKCTDGWEYRVEWVNEKN
jgi:hypothetical protein